MLRKKAFSRNIVRNGDKGNGNFRVWANEDGRRADRSVSKGTTIGYHSPLNQSVNLRVRTLRLAHQLFTRQVAKSKDSTITSPAQIGMSMRTTSQDLQRVNLLLLLIDLCLLLFHRIY